MSQTARILNSQRDKISKEMNSAAKSYKNNIKPKEAPVRVKNFMAIPSTKTIG